MNRLMTSINFNMCNTLWAVKPAYEGNGFNGFLNRGLVHLLNFF